MVPRSCEILMFVCFHKDDKQRCDATKLDCSHCSGQQINELLNILNEIYQNDINFKIWFTQVSCCG